MSDKINFVLLEMTWIRYFMPLVIEANKRGLRPRIFVGQSGKYNCPSKCVDVLTEIYEKYNVDILDVRDAKYYDGLFFLMEAKGRQYLSEEQTKIVLTYMVNYKTDSPAYSKEVDHIIFPSKFLADYYGCDYGDKNLYLGSPKYDIELNEKEILEKYSLSPDSKKVLILAPRSRDLFKIDLDKLYKIFRKNGYEVLVKTRGKDPLPPVFMGDHYFLDSSWYPHTSMELIKISDVVVNFSSTAIKETILLNKPIINFQIKPHSLDILFGFMFEHEYCENFGTDIDEQKLMTAVNRLTTQDLSDEYTMATQKYLFTGNSSERILDHFLGEA